MPPAATPTKSVEVETAAAEASRAVLERVFGYTSFRGRQSEILSTLIEGRDALVLMPTGGGKSLCYQIPALVRPGTGIVVSPLIALMQDQVAALRENGVRAAFLNSTLDRRAQETVERQLVAGELDLLYVAPERLVQDRTLSLLGRAQVSLFAIDEAHCVSEWGHDFRPEYRQLRVLVERFPAVPRIALTATADERTREEIVRELSLQDAARFVSSFDRPNIRYLIADAGDTGGSPRERLWSFIAREHPTNAGIVYCLSRKMVEETAALLERKGRRALAYHAGLDAEVRRTTQERFLSEDGLIVVATVAFGMGIDKPDVRFVAHLNLPKSIEAYYQETGRAGRDGDPADAWMAYGIQDVIQLRQWIAQSEASDAFKAVQRGKLDKLIGLAEMATCRRQGLLAYFGESGTSACGNCDNCMEPPRSIDATELARMALSAVYRTGQRFGVQYVTDVITGTRDERIVRNGHDRLSVYGIGASTPGPQWKALLRQLVALGYLDVDPEGHGSLTLSEQARPLLRGEAQFLLRDTARASPAPKRSRAERAAARSNGDGAAHAGGKGDLYALLRVARSRLAKEAGVLPYMICHDRTLTEIAGKRPKSETDLHGISGLGATKIARYGQALLEVVRRIDGG